MTPVEALSLVGLYRRVNGDFSYRYSGVATYTAGRLGHGELAAQALLPELVSLPEQGVAIQIRLGRALLARDQIHRCFFNHPARRIEALEESLFYLDSLLVSLVGAFDLWARVATEKLQLEIDEHTLTPREVNWGKKWKAALEGRSQELALLLKGRAGSVIDAARGLRNWVHGPPLDAVLLQKEFDETEPCLILTDEKTRSDIQNLIDAYGGEWGVKLKNERVLLLDIPTFSERLTVVSLGAMAVLVHHLVPGPIPSLDTCDPEETLQLPPRMLMPDLRRISSWLIGLSPELA